VANNTAVNWNSNGIYGVGSQISVYGTNAYLYNNIVISGDGLTVGTFVNSTGLVANQATFIALLSGCHSDYNVLNYQTNSAFVYPFYINNGNLGVWQEGILDTYPQWTNYFSGHFDMHSKTALVQMNAAFQPLSTDTVAVGNGTNLTAWGITNDFAGNARPAAGPWTIGAYQIAAGTNGSAPIISVSATSENFGTLAVGSTTNQTLTVQNTGGGTLTGSASVAAPFNIVSGGSYGLAAGQSQPVVVAYSPTAAGTNTQTLTFSGGAGASVALTGVAVSSSSPTNSATPASLNFGTVIAGKTTNQTLTVRNTGGGTLSGSASVAAPFSIVSGGSYSLTAGQSQPIVVAYSPTAAGTNTLTVTFTGANGAAATVTGVAIAPPVVSAIIQNGADVDSTALGLQIFAGSVVQYSCSATDPNGLPLTWQWSYTVNGGTPTVVESGTGAVASVSFNYTAATVANIYVWTLQVSNAYLSASSALTVGVEAPPPAAPGLTFQATSATITAPFVLTSNYISQAEQITVPTNSGQAVFSFTIASTGQYIIEALVNAPTGANNSFYVNIDAMPVDPTMIWDMPITSGFEERIVSWRGNGSDGDNQFVPEIFSLSAGTHELIICGREADTELQSVSIVEYPTPPSNMQIEVTPGSSH